MKYQYLLLGIALLILLIPNVSAVIVSECVNSTYINYNEIVNRSTLYSNGTLTWKLDTNNQTDQCENGCDTDKNLCIDEETETMWLVPMIYVIIGGLLLFLALFIKEHNELQYFLLAIAFLCFVISAGSLVVISDMIASDTLGGVAVTSYVAFIFIFLIVFVYLILKVFYTLGLINIKIIDKKKEKYGEE